jgi:2-iminobutanoate/2-iminopropanoate deaminase
LLIIDRTDNVRASPLQCTREIAAMLKFHTPATVAKPFSSYSHAVEAPPDARWLHISGQVGVLPDGKLAGADLASQSRQAWKNVVALLETAGMSVRDLVKTTAYLVGPIGPDDIAAMRQAREEALRGATPASTAVIVAALVRPEWRIEVEAVAAKG